MFITTMLIDATLSSSWLQRLVHCVGLALLCLLLVLSHLALLTIIVVLIVLCVLDWWWFKSLHSQRVDMLWQGDRHSWYWQYAENSSYIGSSRHLPRNQRQTGKLLSSRHLGFAIHLTFKTKLNQKTVLCIWQDQVSKDQWRYFNILCALNNA